MTTSAVAGVDPRLLQALLRWRYRRLLRHVGLRQQLAIRLLPALLHANFQPSVLKGEALGIEGIRAPRGWAMLSRAFSITPPVSAPRGRRLVRAIFAVPAGESIDLLVLPAGKMSEFEEERFLQRLVAAEGILRRGGADVRVDRLAIHRPEAMRILHFGGVVVGSAPDDELSELVGASISPADAASLVADAPTPLAALSWMLLTGGLELAPMELFQDLHDEGISASVLADPELHGALLVAMNQGDKRMCEVAAVSARDPYLRGFARKFAGPVVRQQTRPGQRQPTEQERLLDLGRELVFGAIGAVRSAPLAESAPARKRLREEVLANGFPIALLPALQEAATQIATKGAADACGEEQAFIRQLALTVRLGLRPPDDLAPFWKRVAALLAEGRSQRTLLLSCELTDEPGPPMDPLNRGPRRVVALQDPLVALLRPSGRPTARRTAAEDAVARMVVEATRGAEIEVIGSSGAAQPAVSRLQRVAKLCRLHAPGSHAIEVGGRVLLVGEDGKLRRFDVRRFAARPRLYTADPESPDLAPPTARGNASPRRFGVSVDCVVSELDEETAYVIYTDDDGYHLREVVPLDFLEAHLQEAQLLLRGATPPALLAVRVAGKLDATRLRATGGAARRMELDVEGDLATGLRLGVLGESFGAGCSYGWKAAAAAVMSQWPQATGGRFVIRSMEVTVHGEPAGPIARLYARSAVLRRLAAHLQITA